MPYPASLNMISQGSLPLHGFNHNNLSVFEPTLRAAAEAIHFEPQKPWTIEALASLAGLSRTSFAVKFQDLTGTSPLAYLTQVRMINAVDLLERTNATLEAIARQVGYGSEAAFSTAFKRELGMSPGAYRRQSPPRAMATDFLAHPVARLKRNAWYSGLDSET